MDRLRWLDVYEESLKAMLTRLDKLEFVGRLRRFSIKTISMSMAVNLNVYDHKDMCQTIRRFLAVGPVDLHVTVCYGLDLCALWMLSQVKLLPIAKQRENKLKSSETSWL